MDLAGCHFTYADVSSREFDLWFAHCDTSDYQAINGTTKSLTVFSSRGNKRYFIANDYKDSPVTIDVELITDDERPLSVGEMREIEKWLFNRKNYYKLYIYCFKIRN